MPIKKIVKKVEVKVEEPVKEKVEVKDTLAEVDALLGSTPPIVVEEKVVDYQVVDINGKKYRKYHRFTDERRYHSRFLCGRKKHI